MSIFHEKPILITTGEPSGIGMDIVIDVLVNHSSFLKNPVLICADKTAFLARSQQLYDIGAIPFLPSYAVFDGDLKALDFKNLHKHTLINLPCANKVQPSVLDSGNADMVERQLNLAHQLALQQKIGAIVTAPIQKSVMIQAGITLDDGQMFSGHTEYFMHKANCDKVVMMLANQTMKVALVTTHLPLRDVADAVNAQTVSRTIEIVHHELIHTFGMTDPKILVCGLNPHAGEDGHLGHEEQTIINPVLQKFRDAKLDISLCLPADTLFTPKYLHHCDVVIAMYHDQGLAPLKSHGFGDTVNITLGLPYIRTSVDHGTALDLAGTGQANSSSLRQAIRYAKSMAHTKFNNISERKTNTAQKTPPF